MSPLNLSGNSIGDEGVKCLCDILVNNSGIERLHLNSSAFGDEKDMDYPMSQFELFNHVHRTNHGLGDFIDKKSKRVHDKYKDSIEFKYGTDRDDQPEFDPDSWINAINGPSKGRIYGFGPRQPVSHVLGTPASPRRSILAHDIMSNEDVNKLKFGVG
ncbi:Uncharacterized protein Adt_27165 [Abeliophyllum distichum]|uniref:Uncharacterized protein n=1 Tax=Abeliophyllum distichum TaxID=126358 RepID=A0ABD1RT01_9LAMI